MVDYCITIFLLHSLRSFYACAVIVTPQQGNKTSGNLDRSFKELYNRALYNLNLAGKKKSDLLTVSLAYVLSGRVISAP